MPFSKNFFLPFILILHQEQYHLCCYVQPLSYRKNGTFSTFLDFSPKYPVALFSTSKNEGDLDFKRSEGMCTQEKNSQKKNEFVNFWGTKFTSNDKNLSEAADPRQIPFAPTLDLHDGPLPPGAYIKEGKSEFDTKSTCRILIDVKTYNVDTMCASDVVVRRLQACIDAGFDTFQLHDQTPMSLAIIKRMNENTPSYINKHWSMKLRIQSISPDVISLPTKKNLRQSVFDLIEKTGSDALDSLKICGGSLPSLNSIASEDMVLETFEQIIEMQREGWIRSIGIEDINSLKLRHKTLSYFDNFIDFEEKEGNLLLPPFLSGPHSLKDNIRIANTLAGGLLTNNFYDDGRGGKSSKDFPSSPLQLLTNGDIQLLNEWTKRRERYKKSSISIPVWKQYQKDVMAHLHLIAVKHDVSISAVALRYSLEHGHANVDTNGEGPIISSALAAIAFDLEDDIADKIKEFRQVFRFRFDEEDRQTLSDVSGSQDDISKSDETQRQEIDFNNPALWL